MRVECVNVMRRTGLAIALAAALAAAVPLAAAGPSPVSVVTILDFSDWHGNLRPSRPPGVPDAFGGAAWLRAYFKQRAMLAPGNTFVVTAGDEVGATPALSSLLGDVPAIEALNRLELAADTFGNHNFDSGVAHMQDLAGRARWPYVAVNLRDADGRTPAWFRRSTTWTTADGVTIGVTGAINTDAPVLVKAGGLGGLHVLDLDDTAAALNEEAAALRASGIGTVIALVHMGATGPGEGPLFDLAHKLAGVDLLLGDHTTIPADQPVPGADGRPLWVVESLRYGWSFTQVAVAIDRASGRAVAVTAVPHPTATRGVQPDPEMQAFIDDVDAQTRPLRETVVGHSTVPLPQNLAIAEANEGNLLTDAVRERYGTDFAFENSGGMRAGFTKDAGPDGNYAVTEDDVLTVLPFANIVDTVEISGTELKALLENGVSMMPQMAGRFPQVSGLQFGYHSLRPPGLRVEWVRWPDGSDVDLSEAERYTVAMNDYMVGGGDGYGPFAGREQTHETLDGVLVDYLAAHDPVSPAGPIPPAVVPETRIFRLD
jgi:2',3'-cyclic-nucleotide 2'-phosphodiesterase (5'-nucleotidase family)